MCSLGRYTQLCQEANNPAFGMPGPQYFKIMVGLREPLPERLLFVVDVARMPVNLVKDQDRPRQELEIMQRLRGRGVDIHVEMYERSLPMVIHKFRQRPPYKTNDPPAVVRTVRGDAVHVQ